MRPYNNIKLTECPDIYDIQSEGRRSRVGRLPRGAEYIRYRGNVCKDENIIHCRVNNDRGYCRPAHKRAVRRYLKRVNRAADARYELMANAE